MQEEDVVAGAGSSPALTTNARSTQNARMFSDRAVSRSRTTAPQRRTRSRIRAVSPG